MEKRDVRLAILQVCPAEVRQPCITPFTRVRPFCARADTYLFWDFIHPTRAGHALSAEAALAALGAP